MTTPSKQHLIVITHGGEDGGQSAILASKLAISLQAMGVGVHIFLTLSGTRWAMEGSGHGFRLEGEPSLEDYIQTFLSAGGEFMVCAPCVSAYCSLPSLDSSTFEGAMRQRSRYAGLASVAERMMHMEATVF